MKVFDDIGQYHCPKTVQSVTFGGTNIIYGFPPSGVAQWLEQITSVCGQWFERPESLKCEHPTGFSGCRDPEEENHILVPLE